MSSSTMETPTPRKSSLPISSHTATTNRQGIPTPLTVAHRGYKGKYPENSLAAFMGAVEAGSHGIETDLRLSRDGVVVLAHDRTLKRCFNVKKQVSECDWEYLQTLKSTMEPHEGIPRLADLLEYLAQPGLEDKWAFLDIKHDNPPSVIPQIAKTLSTIPSTKPWHKRIVLGCWSAQYVPLCMQHLPSFPIALICFDVSYARQFLRIPNVGFNISQKVLMGPLGRGFLEEARAAKRPVYVWTVNEANLMSWSIRKRVDGVVTDNPVVFRGICESWSGDGESERIRFSQKLETWIWSLVILSFGWLYKLRYLPAVDRVGFEDAGKRH